MEGAGHYSTDITQAAAALGMGLGAAATARRFGLKDTFKDGAAAMGLDVLEDVGLSVAMTKTDGGAGCHGWSP